MVWRNFNSTNLIAIKTRILRLPQTYFLFVGLGLGYVTFILWQGLRPIVWLAGAIVVIVAIAVWWKALASQLSANRHDLLNAQTFASELHEIEASLTQPFDPQWLSIKEVILNSQQFATAIAEKEPMLIADLLETLYTVLALAEQVIDGLLALKQMRTEAYRQLAQEKLAISLERLETTYSQLQELHDQITLSNLENRRLNSASLPDCLQLLISENKTGLQFKS